MNRDRRRLQQVVLDVDDPGLTTALSAALSPHHVQVHRASTTAAAVAVLADLGADLVVVAPSGSALPGDADADALHDALALRPARWAAAAEVVGARVVLVSGDDVFDPDSVPRSGHDEFARADAVDDLGRARRAGEARLRVRVAGPSDAPGHAVVRAAGSDDVEDLADLVRWAGLVAEPGTWHLPSTTSGRLHSRHTRLVRATSRPSDGPR